MDQGQTPSTPTRQDSSTSAVPRKVGDNALEKSIPKASHSTPASSSDVQPPAPTSGEPSFNTSSSGDGSIVLHSLSDHTSGSAIESSFEALNLGHTEQASTDSSLEIIVHSSPATTGFLAFSQPLQGQHVVPSTPAPTSQQSSNVGGTTKDTRHSRQSSLLAIAENKALAILSPVAREFAPPPPPPPPVQVPHPSTAMRTFEEIVAFGKDEWGQLTTRAKEALSRLGLKAIPSLHGPLNLPYARCASGIDAFVPSDDPEGEPWGEDEHDEGGQPRQRTLPIPLPGNSRYTQAGRLAMRYSSAPGALESAGKRSSSAPSSPPVTRPPPSNSKKPPPLSQPPHLRQQQSQQAKVNQQKSSANVSNVQAANTQTPQIGSAQMELDAQAFARAQAMQAYFLQQAQLAQLWGNQQGGSGFLAPQPQINLSSSNNQSPPLPNLGFSRAQSPFLPPFQPFTPPVSNASLPNSHQQQQQNYFDNSNQVDSLTLLKLAGQRQLGLNPLQYPISQLNIPHRPLSNLASAGSDVGSEGLGGRQGELEEEEDGKAYDRSAVQYTTGRNGSSGGTGYDFLRQSSSQERRASSGGGTRNNRRNSSSTRPEQHQARSHQGTRSAHESRRRRSAAPTVPYPGHSHSHRKASTSSIVTVNSTIPGPIPQVRIFSDPSSPPTASVSASQRRRSMIPTGRPLEDLANSQLLASTSVSVEKQPRTSPAEASNNWRRPSLPDSGNSEAPSPQVRSPTPVENPASSSSASQPIEAQPSRGRGRGGRGRKRGNRGALKPLGRGNASSSTKTA